MQEREHIHAKQQTSTSTHDEALVPGQVSRSAALVAPDHPVASGLLLRKAERDDNGVANGAEHAVAAASASSGMSLPTAIQRKFEDSLGADLSSVRVHTGGESQASAHAVGAKAYTVGQDIHFGTGHYDPSSAGGEHLLAHEVAHTVQQQGGTPTRQNKLEVSSPVDAAEHEADRAADAMVKGSAATISGFAGLQRKVFRDAAVPTNTHAAAPRSWSAPRDVQGGQLGLYTSVVNVHQSGLAEAIARAIGSVSDGQKEQISEWTSQSTLAGQLKNMTADGVTHNLAKDDRLIDQVSGTVTIKAVIKRVRYVQEGADSSFNSGANNSSGSGWLDMSSTEASATVDQNAGSGPSMAGGGKIGSQSSQSTSTNWSSSAGAQTAATGTLRFSCDVDFAVTTDISTHLSDGATGAAAAMGPVGWLAGAAHVVGNKLGDAASAALKQNTATVTGTALLDIERRQCTPEP